MKKLILTAVAVCAGTFAHAEEKKVEISGNDQMQFDVKAIEVTEGDKVTLILKHTGKLPKVAMGHNVVILKPGTDIAAFATKAMQAAATEYLPADEETKEKIFAHTKLVGGGEEDTITFTAGEPGAYTYICTFPGHFALMQGVLTVKAK